jgi:uncharacterized membrane protein YdjX (TVP38/TMEM64 family)
VGLAVLRWTPLAGYLTGPALETTLGTLRNTWWAPALLIGCYLVLPSIGAPATPLIVGGGVVFGAVTGSIYNVVGVLLGGTVTYYLGRVLGRDFVRQVAGHRLRRVEHAVGRRGFWSLVAVRFLPLPFPLVNYAAAFAGVRPALFFATTAIGVTPMVVIYTYFSAALAHAASGRRHEIYTQIEIAIGLLLVITLLPQFLLGRRRRSRLRRLRAERALRFAADPAE